MKSSPTELFAIMCGRLLLSTAIATDDTPPEANVNAFSLLPKVSVEVL